MLLAQRATGTLARKIMYVTCRWSYYLCKKDDQVEEPLVLGDELNEERYYCWARDFRQSFKWFKDGFNVNATKKDLLSYCDNEKEGESVCSILVCLWINSLSRRRDVSSNEVG